MIYFTIAVFFTLAFVSVFSGVMIGLAIFEATRKKPHEIDPNHAYLERVGVYDRFRGGRGK